MALPRTSTHSNISSSQHQPIVMEPESSVFVTEDDLSAHTLSPNTSTPNLLETVDQIKRSLSITTLQELSQRPSTEVRRSIQKKIWRPHDDEARLPADWERLVIYVFRAGGRAFMLSYGLRSTLSFLLTIVKSLRSRRPVDKKQLKEAFVGENTVRFALAFGVWACVYKFVNNALRLLTPYPKAAIPSRAPMRRTQTAPAATFKLGGMDDHSELHEKISREEMHQKRRWEWKHLSTYDPRVRSWHAYVAGAASSVAFFVEKKSVVRSLTLQIFVRGLEGTYRHARANGMPGIPYGEVIVFGLANVQIIMSWLGAPQYLDRGYKSWIDKASSVPKPTLRNYLSQAANKTPDPWALVELFGGKIPEPKTENPRTFEDLPPNKHAPDGVSGKTIERVYNWMEHGHLDRFPNCLMSHLNTDNHFYATYQNFCKAWKFIMYVFLQANISGLST